MARRERIALPSELAGKSGSRLDPKSLLGEGDHLVSGLVRHHGHNSKIILCPEVCQDNPK